MSSSNGFLGAYTGKQILPSARKQVLKRCELFPQLTPALDGETPDTFVNKLSAYWTQNQNLDEAGLLRLEADAINVASALYFLELGVNAHYHHLENLESAPTRSGSDLDLAVGDLYYANAMVAVAPVGNNRIVLRSARAIRDIAQHYDAVPQGADPGRPKKILVKLAETLASEINDQIKGGNAVLGRPKGRAK